MARTHRLDMTGDARVSLVYYEPYEEMTAHAHSWTQVSCLLAGSFTEESIDGFADVEGRAFATKPPGFEHADVFGEWGALLFSISLSSEVACTYHVGLYTGAARLNVPRLARLSGRVQRALTSVKSMKATGMLPTQPHAPWLAQARHDLAYNDKPIAAVAQEACYSSSAFARSFRSAVGLAPQSYRHRSRVERAIKDIILAACPFGEIAVDAGFADQAHLTRSIRAAIGMSPGQLRRMMAP